MESDSDAASNSSKSKPELSEQAEKFVKRLATVTKQVVMDRARRSSLTPQRATPSDSPRRDDVTPSVDNSASTKCSPRSKIVSDELQVRPSPKAKQVTDSNDVTTKAEDNASSSLCHDTVQPCVESMEDKQEEEEKEDKREEEEEKEESHESETELTAEDDVDEEDLNDATLEIDLQKDTGEGETKSVGRGRGRGRRRKSKTHWCGIPRPRARSTPAKSAVTSPPKSSGKGRVGRPRKSKTNDDLEIISSKKEEKFEKSASDTPESAGRSRTRERKFWSPHSDDFVSDRPGRRSSSLRLKDAESKVKLAKEAANKPTKGKRDVESKVEKASKEPVKKAGRGRPRKNIPHCDVTVDNTVDKSDADQSIKLAEDDNQNDEVNKGEEADNQSLDPAPQLVSQLIKETTDIEPDMTSRDDDEDGSTDMAPLLLELDDSDVASREVDETSNSSKDSKKRRRAVRRGDLALLQMDEAKGFRDVIVDNDNRRRRSKILKNVEENKTVASLKSSRSRDNSPAPSNASDASGTKVQTSVTHKQSKEAEIRVTNSTDDDAKNGKEKDGVQSDVIIKRKRGRPSKKHRVKSVEEQIQSNGNNKPEKGESESKMETPESPEKESASDDVTKRLDHDAAVLATDVIADFEAQANTPTKGADNASSTANEKVEEDLNENKTEQENVDLSNSSSEKTPKRAKKKRSDLAKLLYSDEPSSKRAKRGFNPLLDEETVSKLEAGNLDLNTVLCTLDAGRRTRKRKLNDDYVTGDDALLDINPAAQLDKTSPVAEGAGKPKRRRKGEAGLTTDDAQFTSPSSDNKSAIKLILRVPKENQISPVATPTSNADNGTGQQSASESANSDDQLEIVEEEEDDEDVRTNLADQDAAKENDAVDDSLPMLSIQLPTVEREEDLSPAKTMPCLTQTSPPGGRLPVAPPLAPPILSPAMPPEPQKARTGDVTAGEGEKSALLPAKGEEADDADESFELNSDLHVDEEIPDDVSEAIEEPVTPTSSYKGDEQEATNNDDGELTSPASEGQTENPPVDLDASPALGDKSTPKDVSKTPSVSIDAPQQLPPTSSQGQAVASEQPSSKGVGMYLTKKYRCHNCSYLTMSKSTIAEHIYTHMKDVIPFKCGFCSACFSSKNGAVIHSKREHKGKQPLVVKNTAVDEEKYYSYFNQSVNIMKEKGGMTPAAVASSAKEAPKTDGQVSRRDEQNLNDVTTQSAVVSNGSADAGKVDEAEEEEEEEEFTVYLPVTPERRTKDDDVTEKDKSVLNNNNKPSEGAKVVNTPVLSSMLSTPPAGVNLSPEGVGKEVKQNTPLTATVIDGQVEKLAPPKDMTRQNVDPDQEYYQCRHCTFAAQLEDVIQNHAKTQHSEDSRYTCPMCDSIYCKTQESVKKHFSRMHKGKPISYLKQPDYYKVPRVGETALSRTILNVPVVPVKASENCEGEDVAEDAIAEDEEMEDASVTTVERAERQLYQCVDCSCSLSDLNAIIEHQLKEHNKDFWFACPYCPYGFSRHRINMQRHIRRAHPGKSAEMSFGLVDQEKYFTKRNAPAPPLATRESRSVQLPQAPPRQSAPPVGYVKPQTRTVVTSRSSSPVTLPAAAAVAEKNAVVDQVDAEEDELEEAENTGDEDNGGRLTNIASAVRAATASNATDKAYISLMAKKIAASVQKGAGPPNVTMGKPVRCPPPLVAAGAPVVPKSGPPVLVPAPGIVPPASTKVKVNNNNNHHLECTDDVIVDEDSMDLAALRQRYRVFNLQPPQPTAPKWRQFQLPRCLATQSVDVVPPCMSPYSVPPGVRPVKAVSPLPRTPQSHEQQKFCCPYCPSERCDPDSLHDHILSHTPHITWSCPYCVEPTHMAREDLEPHMTSKHPGQKMCYIPYGVPLT